MLNLILAIGGHLLLNPHLPICCFHRKKTFADDYTTYWLSTCCDWRKFYTLTFSSWTHVPHDKMFTAMSSVLFGLPRCKNLWSFFFWFCSYCRVRVYYVDFFVFFVLRHWWVSQVFTPRMSHFIKTTEKFKLRSRPLATISSLKFNP